MPEITYLSKQECWVVYFMLNGRPYATMGTRHPLEAAAWCDIIADTGWCVSAKPYARGV